MGRPYENELEELDETYRWCLAAPVDELAGTVSKSAGHPLLAIGSGGSLTAAHFACLLHTRFTGLISQVLTPYDLMGSSQVLGHSAILVCSAGGNNPDVLACVENAANRMPHQLFAVTMRRNSPLCRMLSEREWPSCHTFITPTKKDGFLATNSLLATIVLLTRAYETAFQASSSLPPSLSELIHARKSREDFLRARDNAFAPLCKRSTLLVLHGSNTKPAAMDIESRFTEAALGHVQVADYRNFAHGRHHWLAVHSDSSAVISLSSSADAEVAKRTLALFPKGIPKYDVSVDDGFAGALSAVCDSLFLTRTAGIQKRVDPGRPHVPQFGRKLYRLRATPGPVNDGMRISDRAAMAIERKSGLTAKALELRRELGRWTEAYTAFVDRLREARLKAIIFDYDGTLCAVNRRFDGPTDDVIDKMKSLLTSGTLLLVATGRGKSVREALQKRIRSAELRKRIIIGYHNAAEIGDLADATCPPEELPLHDSLRNVVAQLRADSLIARQTELQAKGMQATLELKPGADRSRILELVTGMSRDEAAAGLSVVTSTHSIDVLAAGVSKRSLLEHLKSRLKTPTESSVICIGDRGRWPGNDADLLTHSLSLSVDQVSTDPRTCWNLSGAANRFDRACLEYLEMLTPAKDGARFNVKKLKL